MPLPPGARLGPYEIVSPVGAGGMGEVYRARDTRLNRDVAIKVLPREFSRDPERLLRLEQEAQAAAGLNHPNILAVYDTGEHGGVTFIVSELLDGSTLREVMNAGLLPARRAIEYAIDIARGLAAAHERGVVHRDLKPENVMVTSDRRVKILDFGLAKVTPPDAAAAGATVAAIATQPGLVMGTIGYMAPEQVRGAVVDHRADIFSLGTILYEMMSGERAFKGETPADTMGAILNREPPELARTDGSVPLAVDRVVRRCLEKEPRQRFQSTRDLVFALETTSASGAAAASSGVPVAAPRGYLPRALMLSALVVAAALAGAAAMRLLPSDVPVPALYTLAILPPTGVVVDGPLALSPDGRGVAFTGLAADGVSRLWVRRLDASEARVMAGTDNAWAPFWSADGRSIGFFAQGKMKRVDLAGGPAETLADVTEPRGGTWNADGIIVFAPHAGDGLYRTTASGGPATPVTVLNTERQEVSHRWPVFLPDGRTVLFMNRSAAVRERLVLSSVSLDDAATVRRITPASSTGLFADGRILFLRGHTAFAQRFDPGRLELSGEAEPVVENVWLDRGMDGLTAFAAVGNTFTYRPASMRSRLIWMDREGKATEALGPEGPVGHTLSPDGRSVLFSVTDSDAQSDRLWRMDATRGSVSPQTSTPRNDTNAVWSPDGRRAAFASDRAGAFDIYEKVIGEPGDRLVFQSSTWKWPEDWSPAGDLLLYSDVHARTRSDLWTIPMSGKPTPVAFLRTDASEFSARFSPDGRWVAYVSDESGRDEVYVRPFPRGERAVQVSVNGGVEPMWTKGGRELLYLAPDSRIMAAACTPAAAGFEAAVPSPLFQVRVRRTNDPDRTIAVTRDGNRFLVNQMNTDVRGSTMTVMVGWQSPVRNPQ